MLKPACRKMINKVWRLEVQLQCPEIKLESHLLSFYMSIVWFTLVPNEKVEKFTAPHWSEEWWSVRRPLFISFMCYAIQQTRVICVLRLERSCFMRFKCAEIDLYDNKEWEIDGINMIKKSSNFVLKKLNKIAGFEANLILAYVKIDFFFTIKVH